ncbi:hypothetical protein [Caulobacter sp. NIBR1757]|uniref:hypothetical protein n=1 Tax=Caulobacter sp. NIBR1757 TaxID=3016000 RepID=UPI0022F06716|nr:hypothetical protein [Caulobacter sp. NIBR1757]WGM40647.1 hypothetical protein AMEJIAPC_03594 [Caulobacter sp. NIBR1757]
MGRIHRLIARAATVRGEDAAPVIASIDEARAVANDIARALNALDGRERFLLQTGLADLERALRDEVAGLENRARETREEISRVTRGLNAARAYGRPTHGRPKG